jgi:hypothetical protein
LAKIYVEYFEKLIQGPVLKYLYWKILENTGILVFTSICTSIADTGRFW